MKRTHRVGTLTLGLSLIVFGGLFLAHVFTPNVDYTLIWALWPLILIFLGLEVLISRLFGGEEPLKYDVGGILLTVLLTLFAMAMGVAQFVAEHASHGVQLWNGSIHTW